MRHFPSWLDAFDEVTSILPSPEIFRKWGGISAVAGALERRVFVRVMGQNLYPHLYTVLVAPPGVGKSAITSTVYRLWSELKSHHLASISLSKASLIDDLKDAVRNVVTPAGTDTYNSLLCLIGELGVFLPSYDNEFMNTLTYLWDCDPYTERKRGKGINFKIEKPQLNILTATTPSYLNNLLPSGAWDQGFTARCHFVYSGETIIRPLFTDESVTTFSKEFIEDFQRIGKLAGQMTFTEEAANAISKWYAAGGPPRPDHPRLSHYLTRRTQHLLKLCMIASAAESDDLVITVEQYQLALSWLLEAEGTVEDIFKAMSSGGDSAVIQEVWHMLWKLWVKTKRPIPQAQIIMFLQERVPAHNVGRVLEIMVKARILEENYGEYKPRPPNG